MPNPGPDPAPEEGDPAAAVVAPAVADGLPEVEEVEEVDAEAEAEALTAGDGPAGALREALADTEGRADGVVVVAFAVVCAPDLGALVGFGAAVVGFGAAVVGLGAAVVGFGVLVAVFSGGATRGFWPEPNRKPTTVPGAGS